MRNTFSKNIYDMIKKDKRIMVILGDIGVYSFKDVFKKYRKNIINIGILEQTMVGVAAGMSIRKKIPFIHTISPFVLNRAYEQIKIDICYQNLNVNIVTVGSSFDYSSMGCTHHCPEDIAIINKIPNIKIYYPGNSIELKKLLLEYKENCPKFYRISDYNHSQKIKIIKNKAHVLKKGSKGTIIVFGSTLSLIEKYLNELDVTIIYITTIKPLDTATIKKNIVNNKIIMIQDFYNGSLTYEINKISNSAKIYEIGIPVKFLVNYGIKEEHYKKIKLNPKNIIKKIKKII